MTELCRHAAHLRVSLRCATCSVAGKKVHNAQLILFKLIPREGRIPSEEHLLKGLTVYTNHLPANFHVIWNNTKKQKLKYLINKKRLWSHSSLLKTQFHNLKVPLHTWFAKVKNGCSVNISWGGTFQVELVNLQAFSVAADIRAHIRSVRSDSRGTSSALSHWYKSSQLPWHFAWSNQVAGLLGIMLCQQRSWASWDPHSPLITFRSRLQLSQLQNRINSNLVGSI